MRHIGTAAAWRALLSHDTPVSENLEACLRDFAALEQAYRTLLTTLETLTADALVVHGVPSQGWRIWQALYCQDEREGEEQVRERQQPLEQQSVEQHAMEDNGRSRGEMTEDEKESWWKVLHKIKTACGIEQHEIAKAQGHIFGQRQEKGKG